MDWFTWNYFLFGLDLRLDYFSRLDYLCRWCYLSMWDYLCRWYYLSRWDYLSRWHNLSRWDWCPISGGQALEDGLISHWL